MIVGIGCDIVEFNLTKELNWDTNVSIQNRIFSIAELEIYNIKKDTKFLSGRFAVKEAVLKCLGTGMQDGLTLTDIETLETNLGTPFLKLNSQVQHLAVVREIQRWHVSISYATDVAMALVIAEN